MHLRTQVSRSLGAGRRPPAHPCRPDRGADSDRSGAGSLETARGSGLGHQLPCRRGRCAGAGPAVHRSFRMGRERRQRAESRSHHAARGRGHSRGRLPGAAEIAPAGRRSSSIRPRDHRAPDCASGRVSGAASGSFPRCRARRLGDRGLDCGRDRRGRLPRCRSERARPSTGRSARGSRASGSETGVFTGGLSPRRGCSSTHRIGCRPSARERCRTDCGTGSPSAVIGRSVLHLRRVVSLQSNVSGRATPAPRPGSG